MNQTSDTHGFRQDRLPARNRRSFGTRSRTKLPRHIFALASEVYVLRDRMRTLENVLQRESVIAPNAIEDAEDNELQSRAREDEARQFSRRVLSQFYRPATSAGRVGKKVEDMLD